MELSTDSGLDMYFNEHGHYHISMEIFDKQ